MNPREPTGLRDAARRAYERGRLREALLGTWPVPLLAAISLACAAPVAWVVAVALVHMAVVAGMLYRGRGLDRAVFRGQLAGLVPLAVALGSCRIPHACSGASCSSWCMPACMIAAAVAGMIIVRSGRHEGVRASGSMLAAAVVAALTGGMGCAAIGVGSALAVFAGLAVVAGPAALAAARR